MLHQYVNKLEKGEAEKTNQRYDELEYNVSIRFTFDMFIKWYQTFVSNVLKRLFRSNNIAFL